MKCANVSYSCYCSPCCDSRGMSILTSSSGMSAPSSLPHSLMALPDGYIRAVVTSPETIYSSLRSTVYSGEGGPATSTVCLVSHALLPPPPPLHSSSTSSLLFLGVIFAALLALLLTCSTFVPGILAFPRACICIVERQGNWNDEDEGISGEFLNLTEVLFSMSVVHFEKYVASLYAE